MHGSLPELCSAACGLLRGGLGTTGLPSIAQAPGEHVSTLAVQMTDAAGPGRPAGAQKEVPEVSLGLNATCDSEGRGVG